MWLSALTDKGRVRENNQDAFEAKKLDSFAYLIVCDGMGGENGGQVASRIAVEVAKKQLENGFGGRVTENEARRILSCAVTNANISVFDESTKYPDLHGMGTTMTIAVIKDGLVHVANVGDSRAYLIRDGVLTQLTEDHTFVRELVANGTLTYEEAKNHPRRHMITRAIGAEENVSPDIFSLEINEDDSLLLCSDGLYNSLEENEMEEIIAIAIRKKDVSPMIALANERGGGDNITAALISLTRGGAN
ncbi:MAG: Stp1/IreP family PP2C-type Ser/Thr phosphatase [Oscillospiraceae bacterium]